MNPQIKSMLDAFWMNRLEQDGSTHRHTDPEMRRLSSADDEATAELIVQGLVEYDPLNDAFRWIGPEHGSPEYIAWIKKTLGK